jgi:hypothetical protein
MAAYAHLSMPARFGRSNPPGGFRGDVATAALLAPQSGNGIGLVLPLGDSQYQCGELANYRAAYDLSWGRYLGITRPAPGNHEYITGTICQQPNGTMRMMTAKEAAGAGYHQYLKNRTPPHPGYYSYDWQGWHFVVLNTTCNVDEDWGPGDGDDGHAGVPTIVVGTGGSSLIPFGQVHPASRVRIAGRYGILKIVSDHPAKDRWIHAFKGTDGSTLDRVEMGCH